MSIRMNTEGKPIPPTRRASLRVHPSDVLTQHGRYLADVQTRHLHLVKTENHLPKTSDDPVIKPSRRFLHLVLPFLIGMALMTGIFFTFVLLVFPLGTHIIRQWHYGDSRVSVLEAQVGHQDEQHPTLLLATAYRGRIQVIEFAGGDPAQAQAYTLTYVDLSENPAVSLKTEDVNRDGKLDLIVTVEARSTTPFVLFNNGKSFQPDKPEQKGESTS